MLPEHKDSLARCWPSTQGQAGSTAVIAAGRGGIGSALVQDLLQRFPRLQVIATHRGAKGEWPLWSNEFADRLRWLRVDLTDEQALQRLQTELASELAQSGRRLRLLFNASGLLHGDQLQPEKSIGQLSLAGLQKSFAVNAFAPALLARALWPQLKSAGLCVFGSLSARVGSIGDNRLGGWYSYRAAKAAQNQLLRCLAIEWKRSNRQSVCVALHPGTVDTALSAPFRSGVPAERRFSAERAARQLLDILLALQPADSGRFMAWDGQDIPW